MMAKMEIPALFFFLIFIQFISYFFIKKGTFIALSKLLDIVDNYEKDDLIDIFEIVLALRKDRKMMVNKFFFALYRLD